MLGVGLADAHARRGGAERGRGDLRMDGGGAVAELGGADDELVVAVLAQRDAYIRVVAVRRHGVDHAECDPGS